MKDIIIKIVKPLSNNEDLARREFILNIMLLAITTLTFAAFLINLIDWFRGLNPVVSAFSIFVILIFFIGLYFISRKGYAQVSAYILVFTLFIPITFMEYLYGVDLPLEILSYTLLIVMSGVLLGTRQAFVITILICISIFTIGKLHILSIIPIDRHWADDMWRFQDMTLACVLLTIIATVSWLSNREIEKSLHRARRSEAALKQERDLLEVKVEERTRELKQIQLDKMGQLYRFAEFGRLSSGLFHDLVNPLTAVSLNMEIAKAKEIHEHDSAASKTYIDRALVAAHKMEDFVTSVRKQISKQEHRALFSVNEEIEQILEILAFKAKRLNVSFRFEADSIVMVDGDNIKLSQVFLNLITNALDSYVSVKRDADQVIIIKLTKTDSEVICSVTDNGSGMDEATMRRIFEPFFSTKGADASMGIGLSLVKHIIEKDFSGTIHVTSNLGHGSTFKIQIPHGIKHEQSHQKGD